METRSVGEHLFASRNESVAIETNVRRSRALRHEERLTALGRGVLAAIDNRGAVRGLQTDGSLIALGPGTQIAGTSVTVR